jgi:hypothetical protein
LLTRCQVPAQNSLTLKMRIVSPTKRKHRELTATPLSVKREASGGSNTYVTPQTTRTIETQGRVAVLHGMIDVIP